MSLCFDGATGFKQQCLFILGGATGFNSYVSLFFVVLPDLNSGISLFLGVLPDLSSYVSFFFGGVLPDINSGVSVVWMVQIYSWSADDSADPVCFAINLDLFVFVKIVSRECHFYFHLT